MPERTSLYKRDASGDFERDRSGKKIRLRPDQGWLRSPRLPAYHTLLLTFLRAFCLLGPRTKLLFAYGREVSQLITEWFGSEDVFEQDGCKVCLGVGFPWNIVLTLAFQIHVFRINHPEALRRCDFQPDPNFIRKQIDEIERAQATFNSLQESSGASSHGLYLHEESDGDTVLKTQVSISIHEDNMEGSENLQTLYDGNGMGISQQGSLLHDLDDGDKENEGCEEFDDLDDMDLYEPDDISNEDDDFDDFDDTRDTIDDDSELSDLMADETNDDWDFIMTLQEVGDDDNVANGITSSGWASCRFSLGVSQVLTLPQTKCRAHWMWILPSSRVIWISEREKGFSTLLNNGR